MPESKRSASSQPDEGVVRAEQIEAILDEGLDRYFAAR